MKSAGFSPLMSPTRIARAGISSLQKDIVAYWSFNSSLTLDVTGNGHALTNNNGTTSAAGTNGQAASFSAASSQSLSNGDAVVVANYAAFTIAFWFNGAFQTKSLLGTANSASPNGGFYFAVSAGRSNTVSFSLLNGATLLNQLTATWTTENAWHFVAGWQNGTSMNLQFDAALAAASNASLMSLPPSSLYLGTDAGTPNYYNGLIDEVGIWSRVLSLEERMALYNGGSAVTYPFLGL